MRKPISSSSNSSPKWSAVENHYQRATQPVRIGSSWSFRNAVTKITSSMSSKHRFRKTKIISNLSWKQRIAYLGKIMISWPTWLSKSTSKTKRLSNRRHHYPDNLRVYQKKRKMLRNRLIMPSTKFKNSKLKFPAWQLIFRRLRWSMKTELLS